MAVQAIEQGSQILVPHIEDKPLFFAIRKGTSQLWIRRKPDSDVIREYAYSCATPDEKGLTTAEKNGKMIKSPSKQGYELVDVSWKEFRQKMPLKFYCGIIENHSQQITYLFEHTETGATYEMHWSHFEKMLRMCTVVAGVFFEEWIMVRRRNRYTIVPSWLETSDT